MFGGRNQKSHNYFTTVCKSKCSSNFFDCNTYSLIRGDNCLVQQCLLNLCKNAIEAMEIGGTLSIHTSQDLNNLYIDIKDTGEGMSEEQLTQLGKAFFSTKGEKGTGLGLMITYSILKKMNGSIQVTSKLGVGTTFSLSFPLIENVDTIKNKIV
jgi:two-component system sporulation sensor kinase B